MLKASHVVKGVLRDKLKKLASVKKLTSLIVSVYKIFQNFSLKLKICFLVSLFLLNWCRI